jgi:simple sugar transport system permease protein
MMTIKTPEGAAESSGGEAADAGSLALALEEQSTTRRRLADNQPTTTWAKLKDNIYYMRGRGALEISVVYGLILLVFVITSLVNPDYFPFLDSNNLSGTLSQAIPVLAILSIGAGVLMIAGEFDLSIGAVIGLLGVIFVKTSNSMGWPQAFALTMVVGICVMLINGLIVVYTKIPSFIATLGMSFFWTGASIYVNGLTPSTFDPGVRSDAFINFFAGDYGYFRSQFVWMIVIGAVSWMLLHRHRVGNRIFAVGGNAAAAAAVSIKPRVVRLQAFAFLGLMVAIAAVLLVGRSSGMQPGTTDDYTLLAVAAAVVGGCSLTGGRGSAFGMIIGAALIETIRNALILGKAPGFYVQLFLGLAIVVASVFNKFMEGKAT